MAKAYQNATYEAQPARGMDTVITPAGKMDAMWLVLGILANNMTRALNDEKIFPVPVTASGGRVSAPSGPSSATLGRGKGRARAIADVCLGDRLATQPCYR